MCLFWYFKNLIPIFLFFSFSKTCPWVNFAALLEKWWLPVPIMQLQRSSRLGIFRPTWSLCHPRMSAIQATRFLPLLQFKFSAAAVFVKAPPRGPQTPSPAPRGSHNRTILGGLDPCTKINWTPGCRLAPKTISSKMQRVDPLLQIVAGCFDLFESRRGAFKMPSLHSNCGAFFLSNLIKLRVRIGISRISISSQIIASNLVWPHST